ncbi:MAG: type II toxin-antitoxin system PemK/MazF family toxin [Candidatus Nomurabacteria bacterium]|jgi:mRNA-degrading endonuclease toxin of MazEF toxin-antitoxin module|nr:type II toxin-antitoxin system PemK/MazF family toxin [Candidatus Nomurabacteria bacterium]
MKDYEKWTPVKSEIHNNASRPKYNEGDVFWMSVGENVGFEQDGKGSLYARPVLVVKGFSKELFWGIPLTSAAKSGRYYFSFTLNDRKSTAVLSQIRALDAARMSGKRMGQVDNSVLIKIKELLKGLL